jgi:hypothetical protein
MIYRLKRIKASACERIEQGQRTIIVFKGVDQLAMHHILLGLMGELTRGKVKFHFRNLRSFLYDDRQAWRPGIGQCRFIEIAAQSYY